MIPTPPHAFTVCVNTAVLVQPAAEYPITEYVVVTVGETNIGLNEEPVFQLYEFAPFAVKFTASPIQIGFDEVPIETVGLGLTLTDFTMEFVQVPL